MLLDGHRVIHATCLQTYELLMKPDVLVRAMPGLKSLTEIGDGVYQAKMEMGVAAIKGKYSGELRMEDKRPGESYVLQMHGTGPGGFVDVNMTVILSESPDGTDLHYSGAANVGGTVAGVGQRVLSGVANIIIGQFFSAMAKEAKRAAS